MQSVEIYDKELKRCFKGVWNRSKFSLQELRKFSSISYYFTKYDWFEVLHTHKPLKPEKEVQDFSKELQSYVDIYKKWLSVLG